MKKVMAKRIIMLTMLLKVIECAIYQGEDSNGKPLIRDIERFMVLTEEKNIMIIAAN